MVSSSPISLGTARQPALEPDDVHVWFVNLSQAKSRLEDMQKTLTADEVMRADQFRFEHQRQRFVSSRGMLRYLVGHYLDEDPCEIRFQYGTQGKPALSVSSSPKLFFNLSHSGKIALYAFSTNANLGIDVEYIQPLADASKLVHRYFSPNEVEAYCSLAHEEEKQLAFFRGWTRKEAFVKATGEGLAIPFDQVEVPLGAHETIQFLSLPASFKPEASWQLVDLEPYPNYSAALAVNGTIRLISYLRWPEPLENMSISGNPALRKSCLQND